MKGPPLNLGTVAARASRRLKPPTKRWLAIRHKRNCSSKKATRGFNVNKPPYIGWLSIILVAISASPTPTVIVVAAIRRDVGGIGGYRGVARGIHSKRKAELDKANR